MKLKVKEFSNSNELCKFVNDKGDYIDIETIVVQVLRLPLRK